MTLKLWHNGELKDENTPLLPFHDRIRLGDGVFDTMLIREGKPRFAREHRTRFLSDAKVMALDCVTEEELAQALDDLLGANTDRVTSGSYALNTLVSRGASQHGLKTPDHDEMQLVLRLTKVPETLPPVEAIIARKTHRNEGSPLSLIKSINYGDNILALREAEAAGANEAILLNNARHACCSTSGNLFVQLDGRLYTPPLEDGVMNGITRQYMIKHLDITEKSLSEQELESAEYLYISNSIRGIVPVTKLDGDAIPVQPLNDINTRYFHD